MDTALPVNLWSTLFMINYLFLLCFGSSTVHINWVSIAQFLIHILKYRIRKG